jgi:hypothetical protein
MGTHRTVRRRVVFLLTRFAGYSQEHLERAWHWEAFGEVSCYGRYGSIAVCNSISSSHHTNSKAFIDEYSDSQNDQGDEDSLHVYKTLMSFQYC